MGRLALVKFLIFGIFCLLSILAVICVISNIKPSFLSNIVYAQHDIPDGSQFSDQLDPNARDVTDLPEGSQSYNEKVYENGVEVDNINHLPGAPPGEGEGEGGPPPSEGEDCPSAPGSYPIDTWDRVWCNSGFTTKLSDTPDESVNQFNNDWGSGTVGGIRNDDIGFRSGRTLSLPFSGDYAFSVGSDDGVRVWIDGVLVLNSWIDRGYAVDTFTRNLNDGYHGVRIDYFEGGGDARVSFSYTLPIVTPTPTPTPVAPPPPNVTINVGGCVDGPYSGNEVSISWTNPGVPVSWVDITNDTGGWWNRNVTGLSSTTAPNGFKDGPTQTTNLVAQPNTTYHVGLWNGRPSSTTNFSIPLCIYTISGNVFIDLDQDGIKDPNENNYSSPITITLSGGSVTYPSAGVYNVSGLTLGSKTITFTLPTGYKATYPTGTPISWTVTVGPSCSVGGAGSYGASCDANGNIQNLNFGISNSYPWFVCVGADCRIDPGVNDPIPFGPPPTTANCGTTIMQSYASIPGGLSNSPGIVFTGNTTADFNLGRASSQGWLVGSTSDPQIFSAARTNIIRTAYNYLMTSIKQKGVTPIQIKNTGGCGGAPNCVECNLDNCDPGNFTSSGVYTSAQSLIFKNQAFTFPSAKNYVFLINGDLTIQKDLIVPIGSTVTFSVSRDILIDKNLGETNPSRVCNPLTHQYCNLEGYFSADRNFVIQGNSTNCPSKNDRKLNVAGSIVVNAALGSGAFINERDLCGDNLNCPTFTITERPDFILSAPDFIKYPNYIWREVAP